MEKKYAVALSLVKNIGVTTYKQLIDQFGSAAKVIDASLKALKKIKHLHETAVKAITTQKVALLEKAAAIVAKHEERNITIIAYEEPQYPRRLRQLYAPPKLLYTTGVTLDLNKPRLVAIVGTRKATNYGKSFVQQLVAALLKYEATIVSGMAYGIDICAHNAALTYGVPTVGVMAGGLDMIYPGEHAKQAAAMSEKGGSVSEHPLGVKPEKYHFPARNRIIAGLADVIIVPESAERGGALITAQYGNEFNREVFAVPGNINNTYSQGCHYLIKTHQAHILTTISDLVYIMNWETKHSKQTLPAPHFSLIDLTQQERCVVEVLQEQGALDLDQLSYKTNLAIQELSILTLQLEAKSCIAILPGNKYTLCT